MSSLVIRLHGLPDRELVAELAAELETDLAEQPGLAVRREVRAPQPGERSADVALVGELLIQLLGTTAVTGLIGVLKAYLTRDRSMRVTLRRADGATLELESNHVRTDAIESTRQLVRDFAA